MRLNWKEWCRFEVPCLAAMACMALGVALVTGCAGSATDQVRTAATIAASAADAAGAQAPAPAEATVIDEQLLTISAKAVTSAAKATSALVKNGVITKGSPTAISLAHWLGVARDAILAADQARAALSATSYRQALFRADEAVAKITALISPFGG